MNISTDSDWSLDVVKVGLFNQDLLDFLAYFLDSSLLDDSKLTNVVQKGLNIHTDL